MIHELLGAQRDVFARLDPRLPAPAPPPTGRLLTAVTPDGRAVVGELVRTVLQPGSIALTWSAAHTLELYPLLGDTGGPGMAALLAMWRAELDGMGLPSQDSACVVTWPSHDVAAARALLDHGFMPLTVLAVRSPRHGTSPPPASTTGSPTSGVLVRCARPADLEAAVDLSMMELRYSALVGPSTVRGGITEAKRQLLAMRLDRADPVWVAERDGVVVALAECDIAEITSDSRLSSRLLPGLWAYVNCAAVHPAERGTGVGRALVAAVHDEFARFGVRGSYLYYGPANPLSSTFWPKHDYRPLWTIWEVRPGTAMR